MSETDVCQYCLRTGCQIAVDGHTLDCKYGQALERLRLEGIAGGTAEEILAGDAQIPPRLSTNSAERKRIAIFSGLLRYFPDALAYVAQISWAGNNKHNPGQPMHWNRAKSGDELDCVARHLLEVGTIDPDDGFWHDGKLAWRALANLQKHLEKVNNLPISPGSKAT
jgi:hypothetical protein